MSGTLEMKRARLDVDYAKNDYWLASDLPAGSGVGTVFPHLFAIVALLEDLDFS